MPPFVVRGRPWALPVLLAATVVAFAAGSASLPEVIRIGSNLRWAGLFAVCALALLEAVAKIRAARALPPGLARFLPLPAFFLFLALLSSAWSVDPRLTFERAVSVGVLFSLGAALAVLADDDPAFRRRIFAALAIGAVLVTVTGILMAVAGAGAAVQQATSQTTWRLRGFLENPNTVGVMTAVALPLVTWLFVTAAARRERALWLIAFPVLLGAEVASQSRGGLVAGFVGVSVVLVILVERWPRKVGSVVAVGAVVAAGLVLRQVTQPAPPLFYSAVKPGAPAAVQVPSGTARLRRSGTAKGGTAKGARGGTSRGGTAKGARGGTSRGGTAKGGKSTGTNHRSSGTKPRRHHRRRVAPVKPTYVELPARQDEIGHPLLSTSSVSTAGSGRIAAWKGALQQIRQRPLLGYGFGTEAEVFVDRWYYFQGGTPENSSLGLLLQLGIAGFGTLVLLVVLLVLAGARAVRSGDPVSRSVAAAGLGVLGSALVLTAIQSYIYSVGNVASVTVWTTLFLFGAAVLGKGRRAPAA